MTTEVLVLVAGWIVVGFMGALALLILVKIVQGKIDISLLISEKNGAASLSRFQFLIFTFVIAMSLFLITMHNGNFPEEIPDSILWLLGISGGSYVISKGIQKNSEQGGGGSAGKN